MRRRSSGEVRLVDAIGRTVSVTQLGKSKWELRQRHLGEKSDNAQNPTWVRIDNPGAERAIEVSIVWADVVQPKWRLFGYRKIGAEHDAVRGDADGKRTVFRFDVPEGVSWFGAFPWYTNEDAEAFLEGRAGDARCAVRTIGESGRGRPINCLSLGDGPNVVVLARAHATEASGSFAVEGIADFLLNTPTGKRLLGKRTVHLFPAANPDGVAAGLKLTRRGPRDKYDVAAATMTAADPTMVALREEIDRLRPAALLDFHSYLPSVPGLFFLDDKLGLGVLREMLRGREDEAGFYFRAMNADNAIHAKTLWSHCFLRHQAAVAVAEIPWNFGLLPEDVSRMGVSIFRALMKASGTR